MPAPIDIYNEIVNDPVSMGYGAFVPARFDTIWNILSNGDGAHGRTIIVTHLTVDEINGAIVWGDFNIQSNHNQLVLTNMIYGGPSSFPVDTGLVRSFFVQRYAGTTTLTNLNALLANRTGSRMEELKWTVTRGEIDQAYNAGTGG